MNKTLLIGKMDKDSVVKLIEATGNYLCNFTVAVNMGRKIIVKA
nr:MULTISPECIES: single-stranded DNA-binding protein [Clostridium]